MDLSCIISSGDLELYVLGMLSEEEAEKITALAGLFPEIKDEIDRISDTLLNTGKISEQQPSLSVKAKLMQQLTELKATETTEELSPAHSIRKGRTTTMPWLAAASVAAVMFATGFFYTLKQSNSKDDILNEQGKRISQLEKNVTSKDEALRSNKLMLDMLKSEIYRKINLKQMPGGNPAEVELFWNTKTKEVYVGEMQLPAAPAGKQYQLWAIVDGKPVDAGMMTSTVLQKMKSFEKAEAFAVTLENEGGSPSPTMSAMIVMANT